MLALPISMPRLKRITIYQNSPKIKLILKKKCKIIELWGLRPRTPCLRRLEALPRDSQPPAGGDFAPRPPMVSRGWGLRPQTPKTASHCEFLATRLLTYANVKTWFEFDLQTKRLKGLGNLRISSRFLISAALVFPMAYKKRSKCDPNDVKVVVFFKEIAKIAQRLGYLPPDAVHNTLELHPFAQHAAQLATFFEQDHFSYWFKPCSKILVAAVRLYFIR